MARKSKQVNLDFLGTATTANDASVASDVPTVFPRRQPLSGIFSASVSDLEQAQSIEIERLQDNPYQPRLTIEEAGLQELAQVIKTQGFQGVLVARPHPDSESKEAPRYQLTAGHRRREAARVAGLKTLPVVIKELSNEEMVSLAITENIQREDLTPLEEGKIFLLMSEEMGYTHEQIAREIGKNRGYVENRLRVARAPQDIQELVIAKPDSLRAVSTLIKIKDQFKRTEIISLLINNKLTADDLPGYLTQSQTAKPETENKSGKEGTNQAGQGHLTTYLNGAATSVEQSEEDLAEFETDSAKNKYELTSQSTKNLLRENSLSIEENDLASRTSNPKKIKENLDDEAVLARVGNSKLNTVLRTLRSYLNTLAERQTISNQEQEILANINELLEEIKLRHKSF